MNKKKHNLPKKLVMGKDGKSRDAKAPIISGGSKPQIGTTLNDIEWNPAKIAITAAVLSSPYLIILFLAFKTGNTLVGIILIGIAFFVGLMYLALRYIEKNEF